MTTITVYGATLADVKRDTDTTISEQAREGLHFTRVTTRKTGANGIGAYEAEITFTRDRATELRAEWNRICNAMNEGTWRGTEADALAEIERIKAKIAAIEVAA